MKTLVKILISFALILNSASSFSTTSDDELISENSISADADYYLNDDFVDQLRSQETIEFDGDGKTVIWYKESSDGKFTCFAGCGDKKSKDGQGMGFSDNDGRGPSKSTGDGGSDVGRSGKEKNGDKSSGNENKDNTGSGSEGNGTNNGNSGWLGGDFKNVDKKLEDSNYDPEYKEKVRQEAFAHTSNEAKKSMDSINKFT